MSRKPRIQYEGAAYHIMSRGDHGENIFQRNSDREIFIKTLERTCERTGWKVHAYVLMSNHYHLLIETPEANLVDGMKWLQSTYTIRYNLLHKIRGHLFQGRYKALIIDPEEVGYFERVSTYIHLNPVRANLINAGEELLQTYRWSSYPAYLKPRIRKSWQETKRSLSALYLDDDREGRKAYERYIEERAKAWLRKKMKKNLNAEWKEIRQGWYLGGESFRNTLLVYMDEVLKGKKRDSHEGIERRNHDEAEAERLIQQGFKALMLEEKEIIAGPKGSNEKRALAWLVKQRTSVRNGWIADRLDMGHPSNISQYVAKMNTAEMKSFRRKLAKILQ